MKATDSRFEMVDAAVPPPGSFHTATASTMMIAMLRRCLPRSGPTPQSLERDGGELLGARLHRDGRGGNRLHRRCLPVAFCRLGGEAVADPEVGVDVAPAGRDALELGAQLAHEDVHRAVAVDHGVAPHALVDLLALQDLALGLGQQLDQLVLAAGELDGDAGHESLELVGTDLDLADDDGALLDAHVGALAAADDRLDPRDQLFRMTG